MTFSTEATHDLGQPAGAGAQANNALLTACDSAQHRETYAGTLIDAAFFVLFKTFACDANGGQHMKWLKRLFGSEKDQPDGSSTDDPMATTDPMIGSSQRICWKASL